VSNFAIDIVFQLT